ncbi:hypothetical protein DYB37_003108 [Aphanomyces astaci]|uniref:Uncharacterized protein n=1 Tax=Aphanomyces astaci TaxID=112090 RepID=A0A3L6VZZ5_APHAT|nr:hypothetical protein DYB35_008113 [Aphanomyces astaci]RHZ03321.1 hypothetical protein DYB37_003108 [Aphanomyces astaci]RLO14084.1 hypothetical protein DYB28_013229 [Aphanomyces astaci]
MPPPEDADEWTLPRVKFLLETQEVNARSPLTGRSLLHDASIRGMKDVVLHMLANTECDVEVRTMLRRFGSTPLHYCTKRSVAVHLIQFGARVLAANKKRKTAAFMIQSNEEADSALKTYINELADAEYNVRRQQQR